VNLAQHFEHDRGRLRAIAYRMLGSTSDADDALQDAWLRVSRAGIDGVDDVSAWLTTVVSRVCLNMLRARGRRREAALEPRLPDPIVTPDPAADRAADPEEQALLADAVGMALQVVIDTLGPAERLAFVLHDVFGVDYEEVARIVGRSPESVRQLASRARRRVRGAVPDPETQVTKQRAVVDAFLAAARGGDFDALVRILDPDVVVRADYGPAQGRYIEVRGASDVAATALRFRPMAGFARPALVNGAAGIVVLPPQGAYAVLSFGVSRGKIFEIDIVADPERLAKLELPALN
jgi:RNA polymerase sigma-70 factor (ECF subfamily)